MMGDMTGMDLHAEVERRWPQLAQRFVFMTGGAFIEAASKFLKRIPNACVEKPFDLDTLRAAVATRR